jgi:tRNA A-37 threonylcarbamoyl transferase component Bud32
MLKLLFVALPAVAAGSFYVTERSFGWLLQVNLLVLLEQAAQGVGYMHSRHVIHGDLNVRLVEDEGS